LTELLVVGDLGWDEVDGQQGERDRDDRVVEVGDAVQVQGVPWPVKRFGSVIAGGADPSW
jgi:hypothetical protein